MKAFAVLYYIIFIALYIWMVCATYEFAERRGRNGVGYAIGALFFTPLFMWIILLLLGETDEHRKARIIEEEMWRRNPEVNDKECHEEKEITDLLTEK